MPPRRFPAPWTAEVTPNCFIVSDANGQQLAYVSRKERLRDSLSRMRFNPLTGSERARITGRWVAVPTITRL